MKGKTWKWNDKVKNKISESLKKHFTDHPPTQPTIEEKEKRRVATRDRYKEKTKTSNPIKSNICCKGNVRLNKRQKYEAFIPASWNHENKRRTLGCFLSQSLAQNAIDLYYSTYVQNREKPYPCIGFDPPGRIIRENKRTCTSSHRGMEE